MLWDFVKKYYIDSIVYKQGYNPVNTMTWAVILVLAAILIYKVLRKKIDFDEKFIVGNVPFILLGSSVRVVEDAGFLQPPLSYFFMTPLIYVMIFCIAFPTLLLSIRLRGEKYWLHYSIPGLALSGVVLAILFAKLEVVNAWILPTSLLLAAAFSAAYKFITSKLYRPMSNSLSCFVFFSHMVDGWATFFGVTFLGYWELHVLPRFLISAFGPWIMIPTKVFVFAAILYVLDSSKDDEKLINFVKFVLVVLGLAPGLRDSLRMTFQV